MEFEKFRDEIIKEIEQKNELNSADKKSGIYVIYIENFDYKLMDFEQKILPIYIGQSKDMYKRMLSHKNRLTEIFSYTINEFNKNLKNKKENQYLYHKIRKCINDTSISVENIKFKVIEYCDENELLERERYYIDLYKSESLGLNQLSSVQKMVTTKIDSASDEEIINLLNLIAINAKQVLSDQINNYGFSFFNASMLCYNAHIFLEKIEKAELKKDIKYSEEVVTKFNETLEWYGKLFQETSMIIEPGIPYFIEWDLKLKKRR